MLLQPYEERCGILLSQFRCKQTKDTFNKRLDSVMTSEPAEATVTYYFPRHEAGFLLVASNKMVPFMVLVVLLDSNGNKKTVH